MDLVVCTACGIPNRIKLQANTNLRPICGHCRIPLKGASVKSPSDPSYIHFPAPRENEIMEAEKNLGIKFHSSYRKFLQKGYPVPRNRFQPLLIGSECEDLCSTAEEHWCVFNISHELLPFAYDTETNEYYYINQVGHVVSLTWSDETDKYWPSIKTWQQLVDTPNPLSRGLSTDEIQSLIKLLFDNNSPRAGHLVELYPGGYIHYGVALSDDVVVSWKPRAPGTAWGHRSVLVLDWLTFDYVDSKNVQYLDRNTIFSNILAASFAFHDKWDYCLRGWNCEHWARLVVSGIPLSEQVRNSWMGLSEKTGGHYINPDAVAELEKARNWLFGRC